MTELQLLDADTLAMTDEHGVRRLLTDLMGRCKRELSEISDRIGRGFFAHSEAPVALQHQGKGEPDDEDAG